MTKEEYKKRISEIYNLIGELGAERDKMINERIALITKDLEDIGLKFGMEVDLIDGIIERRCIFNGVRCNSQHYIYLEFTYHDYTTSISSCYVHSPMVVDVNHDIKVILPQATFDYHTFMKQYQ